MLIITSICLYLMFGMGGISYAAGPFKDAANVQEHIRVHLEKVKLKNPRKYQEMMLKTGGNIAACVDCHPEAHDENLPVKKGIDSGNQLRK